MNTKTVELRLGYLDPDGKRHRTCVVRTGTAQDSVDADTYMQGLKSDRSTRHKGESNTLYTLARLARCVVQLGEIRKVTVDHLLAMSERDVARIMEAQTDAEEEAEQRALGNESDESSG